MELKPIELQHMALFNRYYALNNDISSEYNFTTLYAWQEMYNSAFAIVENCLCVKSGDAFMYPIGEQKEDVARAIEELRKYQHRQGKKLTMICLTPRMLEEVQNLGLEKDFIVTPRRDLFDYVYQREKLVTLSGKKLHGKKNHFNYFINHYSYSFVDIQEENEAQCKEKLKKVIFERSLNPEQELFATLKVLKDRDTLGFVSKCLFVDNEIVGIIMGQNHNDSLLIQIAKSDVEYRGASVALFKFFIAENFLDCAYVNFMEDLGIEGLRKMKLSYDPDELIEKYLLTEV